MQTDIHARTGSRAWRNSAFSIQCMAVRSRERTFPHGRITADRSLPLQLASEQPLRMPAARRPSCRRRRSSRMGQSAVAASWRTGESRPALFTPNPKTTFGHASGTVLSGARAWMGALKARIVAPCPVKIGSRRVSRSEPSAAKQTRRQFFLVRRDDPHFKNTHGKAVWMPPGALPETAEGLCVPSRAGFYACGIRFFVAFSDVP